MSKMKKEKTTVDAVDRTLQLPEHLQHRILSSLPFEDAVRTSVLSKRWKNMWMTAFTTLEFDNRFFDVIKCKKCVHKILVFDEDFNEVDLCPCKKKRFDQEEIYAKKEEGLLNFVERTLRIRHSRMVSLENLVLHLPFYRSTMTSSLNECIRYALECSVKNLDLKVKYHSNLHYSLPQTVFAAAKSLANLSVQLCTFESSNLNLCSLKTLNLQCVDVDDLTFQNLIANCPVIEDLSLDYCHDGKGSLKICGIVNPYLVMVKVQHCSFERVEIATPVLQSFTFNANNGKQLPCEINVSNWENMRELSLCYSSITDRWFRDHISHLPFLETLSLVGCDMLQSIKIVSCRLKHFAVGWCSNLVKVDIDDPNLSSFDYGGENMISLTTNALALHRVVLSLYPLYIDNLWYVKLIEFLGKLNNVKVLKFVSSESKDTIVPKELRNSLLPPLHNFKHLTLKYDEDWSSEKVEEILDGAVWFSSHPVTCYTSATFKDGMTFEFHQ